MCGLCHAHDYGFATWPSHQILYELVQKGPCSISKLACLVEALLISVAGEDFGYAGMADKDALVRAKAMQHLLEVFPAVLRSGNQFQPILEKVTARYALALSLDTLLQIRDLACRVAQYARAKWAVNFQP